MLPIAIASVIESDEVLRVVMLPIAIASGLVRGFDSHTDSFRRRAF
jgi:hypothetical protein